MKAVFTLRKRHIYTYFLAVYFFLAPMEDLLAGPAGTIARYIAIAFIVVGAVECRGQFAFQKNAENYLVITVSVISILSLTWSIDFNTTLARLTTYLLLPGYCIFMSMLRFDREEFEFISKAAIIGALFTALYMFLTGSLSFAGRVTIGESSDPNNFAARLLLPISLCFQQRGPVKIITRVFYYAAALLLLFCMLLTGSRGGLLAAVVVVIVFLLLTGAYKKAAYLIVFTILAFIVWEYVLPSLPERIRWRLFNYESYLISEANSENRTAIWRNVIYFVIPDMHIWGLGAGCPGIALSSIYGHIKGVHNTYLNMICEYGIFGIGFFAALLSILFIKLKARKCYLEAACLIGMCVVIFFLDSYAKKYFWNVIMITYLAIMTTPVQGRARQSLIQDSKYELQRHM